MPGQWSTVKRERRSLQEAKHRLKRLKSASIRNLLAVMYVFTLGKKPAYFNLGRFLTSFPKAKRQPGDMGKETEWLRSCLQPGHWKIFALWHRHLELVIFCENFTKVWVEKNMRKMTDIRPTAYWLLQKQFFMPVTGKSPFHFRTACPFFCGGVALHVLWPGSSFLSFVDIEHKKSRAGTGSCYHSWHCRSRGKRHFL